MRISPMTSRAIHPLPNSVYGAIALLLLCMSQMTLAMECEPVPGREAGVSVHCGNAPSATFDSNGRLWVTFVQDQHVYVSYSDNRGETYAAPVKVNAIAEDAEYNGENRPKILTRDGHTLFVSWTVKTSPRFTGEIRFARSEDGGRSFESPRTINDDQLFTGHRFESMYLTTSGTLYITWIDKRDLEASMTRDETYVGAAIYYAVSTDAGATFSTNYRVANNSCECCRIAVAANGSDKIAILWRQIFGEDVRDHAFAVLAPDGVVSAAQRATYDEWHINACPHHGPAMVIDAGSDAATTAYHIAWFSNGDNHKGIHYGNYSTRTGKTSQVKQVDATPGAGHPFLANFADTLFLVWKGFDGRATNLQLIKSVDGGSSWSEPETLLSTDQASDYPLLVTSADGVFLSWHTVAHGYQFKELAHGN